MIISVLDVHLTYGIIFAKGLVLFVCAVWARTG